MIVSSTPAVCGKVLIVDDTPNNLRLLTRLLRENHYEVRAVTSGKMALTVVESMLPDLILLDICMPEIDGYEVCRCLKAADRTRHIPVIFLSALDEVPQKVKAFEMGGVDYITKPFELAEVLMRVQTQLALSTVQKQLQQLNASLEQEVVDRTSQLQQAVDFEASLKRIMEKVRDSLDEAQIMQTAVQELAIALNSRCCNAAIYDLQQRTSTIRYEYTTFAHSSIGRLSFFNHYPELYHQLLQGQICQFCSIKPSPLRGQVAMLACPIRHEQEVLGDLWIIDQSSTGFTEQAIGLIQQVANQCAIALRQSRLYRAAQAQVVELQRLSRLKDDFLSTVSHELRTPMSNIQLAAQLLEMNLMQFGVLTDASTLRRYIEVLKDQCQQEIQLINNLLDLTHLDSQVEPLILTQVELQMWLPHVVEPFLLITQTRQQQLHVDVPADLPPIVTDLSYLERILSELITNATKYSPANEHITVSASLEPEPNQLVQTTTTTGEACLLPLNLIIRVTNSGVEIPAQEHDRIFERFYRIPDNDPWQHSGTGLGLALVKKFVERLEGTIAVTSGSGQTTFTIKLPKAIRDLAVEPVET
jgi:signal transduction histidine kinase